MVSLPFSRLAILREDLGSSPGMIQHTAPVVGHYNAPGPGFTGSFCIFHRHHSLDDERNIDGLDEALQLFRVFG